MASQRTPRQQRLLNWLCAHDITFTALGRALGVSATTARTLVVADTISTWLYDRCFSLGLPVDLLPEAIDRKPGPKPKIPRFPERRDATLAQASEKSPANGEGSFA